MKTLETRAKEFASYHHARVNQRRKYTGEPYITHPEAVAEIVRSVPHTEEMLAAAWLHDTVEDTEATFAEIEAMFGVEVCCLVEQLTDVSSAHDGLREHRKEMDRRHMERASPAAKTVKLADLIHNCESITRMDPKFAKIYLAEKRELLKVLKEGDPILYTKASELLGASQ